MEFAHSGSLGRLRLIRLCWLMVMLVALPSALFAVSRVEPVPVPQVLRSQAFTVKVDGKPVDVAHAAASLEYASFDISGPVTVEVTAADPDFWKNGVDVEPWRLGIRPERKGATLRFRLDGPAKISLSRPRDFLNHAAMLYLFAGAPTPLPRDKRIHAFMPGVYHGSLNPKSGESIYLAPGVVIYGSLNLWKVHDVRVFGRGTIVYEGSQDPTRDEGWMQKPDWHCVGALEAHNVQIQGLTCVVRARTWSIQMKDSTGFVYDDLRVMGGNPGNANQDGMDWLGGGDAVVRNSFLRASDDVFAVQGNWDGYTQADLLRPGHDVANIVIEHSQVSTSISNIVRAQWPQKNFNSRNFTMRDVDVLHGGIGACGQPFALLGMWGANNARGSHTDYKFENIFLDNWYSLVQIEQEQPELKGFLFRNIWALDQPPLTDSTLTGAVSNVTFDNVKLGQKRVESNADLPLVVSGGAEPATFAPEPETVADFSVEPPFFAPGKEVGFTARAVRGAHYTWLFGDGTRGEGREVKHRFPDALGTEYDGRQGAGRFRVLLHVETKKGEDWAARAVVAVEKWKEAQERMPETTAGLSWQIYPGPWTQLPDLSKQAMIFKGESQGLHANSGGYSMYAAAWDGYIDIPADGGYTFHLMARDGARVLIDGVQIAKTGEPFAQVCGAPGNAVRYDRGSLGLRAGKHTIHVEGLHARSEDEPRLLWEGPGLPLTDVPPQAYSHARLDRISR
jgi:hypothetical protein